MLTGLLDQSTPDCALAPADRPPDDQCDGGVVRTATDTTSGLASAPKPPGQGPGQVSARDNDGEANPAGPEPAAAVSPGPPFPYDAGPAPAEAVPAGLRAALAYLRRGFSVVPQLPGAKHPCVQWKAFQERLPTENELRGWFRHWPQAGLAVILGPVSNLLALDVDGPEAHEALVGNLGAEPVAPKVLSGSGKPCRYHLFFKHPNVATLAKFTPWHPKLEFRGHRGIIILPPSVHRSGNSYRFAEGRSFDDLELPELPAVIVEELVARAVRKRAARPRAPGGAGGVPSSTAVLPLSAVQRRARAYLAKVPPAVEGCGGDRQTFSACCVLAVDFGLSLDQGLPLLLEYNGRCVPRSPEHELVRKLEEALKRAEANPEKRGWRLREGRGPSGKGGPAAAATPPPEEAAVGSPFLGTVPDYVLADWEKVKPRPRWRDESGRLERGRRPAYRGLLALLHREVVGQKRATVCLPDVVCAQVVWGDRGSWPRNWRQRVRGWLRGIARALGGHLVSGDEDPPGACGCPPTCPLLDHADVRHQHHLVTLPKYDVDYDRSLLGVLELFRVRQDGQEVFDFARAKDDDPEVSERRQEQVKRWRSSGRICSVYLPALVFGPSPRSGLTWEQRGFLRALTRELTRSHRSDRPDKAAAVVGGQPQAGGAGRASACPFLESGQGYVQFNGNGRYKRRHLRGRGYHLIGKSGRGWLWRAGYGVLDAEQETSWKAVRAFLKELRDLPDDFGLVAAGWHPRKRQWRCLDDLIQLTRTPARRAWLNACVLRVYAPEDYPVRWRQYFAKQLGFSFIPGGEDEGEQAPRPAVGAADVASAADLGVWMGQVAMTDEQLAGRLGVSRSLVSGYRSGRRPWSRRFQNRVTVAIAAYHAEQGRTGHG
jgi:hypothetical protein